MGETSLDDIWWGTVDYILTFTAPIKCWIKWLKQWESLYIDMKERQKLKNFHFYEVVHSILIDHWTMSSTSSFFPPI